MQKQLTSNILTSNDLKVISYTIQILNRTKIEDILKKINEESLSFESKIYILHKLSTLPRVSIPLEAKNASALQAEWSKKKIKLKKELESIIKQNYTDQKAFIEFDKMVPSANPVDDWKTYRKALKLYNTILDKNDPLKKEIETEIQKITKTIATKNIELALLDKAQKIKNKKNNATVGDLQEYKKELEKYIISLGKFKGNKAKLEKEKRTQELANISQRIETLKNKHNYEN
jgi:hypothetical protein